MNWFRHENYIQEKFAYLPTRVNGKLIWLTKYYALEIQVWAGDIMGGLTTETIAKSLTPTFNHKQISDLKYEISPSGEIPTGSGKRC